MKESTTLLKFDKEALEAIRVLKEDPGDVNALKGISNLYWPAITSGLREAVHGEEGPEHFLTSEESFINFGLIEDLVGPESRMAEQIRDTEKKFPYLTIAFMSQWLQETINEIREGNRSKMLLREIDSTRMQIRKFEEEIESIQESRERILMQELVQSSTRYPERKLKKMVEKMREADSLRLCNLRSRKAASKGKFLKVEERRELAEREKTLAKDQAREEGLMTEVENPDERRNLKQLGDSLSETFERIVDAEQRTASLEKQIEEIELRQTKMSPMEVESRIVEALDYVRDMVKLSAKRLRLESCSILKPGEQLFTLRKIQACLSRILEFDPKVFSNDRVAYLGRPGVLLCPGNGNALYDWKNNMLIVPLAPMRGDFMASIAYGIIEYRFDTDEDKKLIGSYAGLPENKGVKSVYRLKERLAKEYVQWMSQEYKGFRVLSRDIRRWFEREIGPDKNDIYCPPEFQPFNTGSGEVKKLIDRVEARLADTNAAASPNVLWAGSILHFQMGNFKRAYECSREFVQSEGSKHRLALYNFGHIAAKVSRKQEAVDAFGKFVQDHPQSWWASVARAHLKRLQLG